VQAGMRFHQFGMLACESTINRVKLRAVGHRAADSHVADGACCPLSLEWPIQNLRVSATRYPLALWMLGVTLRSRAVQAAARALLFL
jgi:hypothetical protein